MEENIIRAMENHYTALMDKYYIKLIKSIKESDLETSIEMTANYSEALNQFNFVQKLKTLFQKSTVEKDEN